LGRFNRYKRAKLRFSRKKVIQTDIVQDGVIHFEHQGNVIGDIKYKINSKRIYILLINLRGSSNNLKEKLSDKEPYIMEQNIPYTYDKAQGILTLTINNKVLKFKSESAINKEKTLEKKP